VTVQIVTNWSIASCVVNKGIQATIEWAPNTAQNPGAMKHFRECTLMFKNNFFANGNIGFWSESSSSIEYTQLAGSFGGLWGLFGWGSSSWGGAQRPNALRTYIPLEKTRCSQLSIRFQLVAAYCTFQLEGYSIVFSGTTTRIGV
jgi:hypothetical protein